jgi:hypothetical protein
MVVHSEKNDSDFQDDSDTDSSLPKTEEEMFAGIDGIEVPPRR